MKRLNKIFALLFLLVPATVFAQSQTIELTLSPKSTMKVDGTSTLHSWSMNADSLMGTAKVQAFPAKASDRDTVVIEVAGVKVYAEGLKSGEGGLDKKAYGALDTDKYPMITYELEKLTINGSTNADANSAQAMTTGKLTIKDVTREIEVPISVNATSDSIEVKGEVKIDMKDYDVKPPSVMFGAIKSGKDITITFDLKFTSSNLAQLVK